MTRRENGKAEAKEREGRGEGRGGQGSREDTAEF